MAAYAIGVANIASMNSFKKYCSAIIKSSSLVVTAPKKAMSTNGTESKRYAIAELPIVRIHR